MTLAVSLADHVYIRECADYQAVAMTIVLFLIGTIAMFIRSSPKASGSFVWGTFINLTGWPDGVCFFNALLTTSFIFAGLDAALHMAEEAPNPRTSVPVASVSAIGIGFVTAFIYAVAMLYSIADYEQFLQITGYLPFELTRMALRSDWAAAALQLAGTVMTFFILNAVFATASRMTWALARDNALVFSKQLGNVHDRLKVPVSSILTVWAILSLCGLLILASELGRSPLPIDDPRLIMLCSLQCARSVMRHASATLFRHASCTDRIS